jgi:hypothetical protein
MQRREFIAGLGVVITGSIRTKAQELPIVPLVGHLDDGPAEGFVSRQVLFREGLAVMDYFEGCNVAIESHRGRLAYWASDLVDRSVAVLVASGSVEAVLAAKAATTTIPVVFGFGADPIETGLVSSLEHPGGNITGVTSTTTGMGSKRLGLLRDLLPRATRVAVLVDPNDDAMVVKSNRGRARSGRRNRAGNRGVLRGQRWRHRHGFCEPFRKAVRGPARESQQLLFQPSDGDHSAGRAASGAGALFRA